MIQKWKFLDFLDISVVSIAYMQPSQSTHPIKLMLSWPLTKIGYIHKIVEIHFTSWAQLRPTKPAKIIDHSALNAKTWWIRQTLAPKNPQQRGKPVSWHQQLAQGVSLSWPTPRPAPFRPSVLFNAVPPCNRVQSIVVECWLKIIYCKNHWENFLCWYFVVECGITLYSAA